jgi:hypothetical protein
MRILKFLFFNWFTDITLYKMPSNAKINRRLGYMPSELIYTTQVLFPVIVVGILIVAIIQESLIGIIDESKLRLFELVKSTIGGLAVIGMLNKDFINGQSVVHRVAGFQVVDVKTLEPANQLKCLTRNITGVILPIEFIMISINPQRRLGDFIAGTKLISVNPTDPKLILEEMRVFRFDLNSKLALIIPTIIYLGWLIMTEY